MNYLIFDIEITGHHTEYIQYLMEYLALSKDDGHIYNFVLNPEFEAKFPQIAALTAGSANVKIIQVSKEDFIYAKTGSLLKQSIRHYRLLSKYVERLRPDTSILLLINIFQIPLGIFRPKCNISGILFSQFTRQAKDRGVKGKIRYARRYLQTWLFVKNNRVKTVFLLNDRESCSSLNSIFKSSTFKYLPDPVPDLTIEHHVDVRKEFGIGKSNTIFLHFGSLSDRKGTFEVLKALSHISSERQVGITIAIIGKVDSEQTRDTILRLIEQLEDSGNKVQIIFKEGFCSNNLKNNLFSQSNVILIPYKNVEASSGIFGHAVAAGKSVIGGAAGLLGQLINENELGAAIERLTPENLAKAMERNWSYDSNTKTASYLNSHRPELFAETLLDKTSGDQA